MWPSKHVVMLKGWTVSQLTTSTRLTKLSKPKWLRIISESSKLNEASKLARLSKLSKVNKLSKLNKISRPSGPAS